MLVQVGHGPIDQAPAGRPVQGAKRFEPSRREPPDIGAGIVDTGGRVPIGGEMLFQLILGTLLIAATVTVHGVFMVTYLWRTRQVEPDARSFWAVIRILAQLASLVRIRPRRGDPDLGGLLHRRRM